MSRNYQRDERDWRRQQPSWQEDDQWSNNRSDDDFSMGLGQESRGSRSSGRSAGNRQAGEGRGQRSGNSYQGRERENSVDDYRASESGWDQANEGFQQQPSRWQRSQFRGGAETPYGNSQVGGRQGGPESWREPYEGSGFDAATHRGEGPFAGRGPRNYKRPDERIEEDVNERLTRHGNIDAVDVEVTVQNGEVTLRGTVDTRQAKRLAEDIADSVGGVKEVNNQIKIKQRGQSSEAKSDTEQNAGKQQRKAS